MGPILWYVAGRAGSLVWGQRSSTVRDQADLHEAYVELFPAYKTGFGLTAGRMMLNYGEGRLIGTPQWSNLARTYDHARMYWRSEWAQIEALVVSPVKVCIGEFNRPVLGDDLGVFTTCFPTSTKTVSRHMFYTATKTVPVAFQEARARMVPINSA